MTVLPRRRRDVRSDYDVVASRSAAVVIRSYSTSFGWASRLLAAPERGHVRNIYALVRVADEIVDDPQQSWSVADRRRLLDTLEDETAQALSSGRSANLVVHAFSCTARAHGIGPELLTPFFASMRADLTVGQHDDASLAEYVHGSAEVVGLMCLRVFVGGDDESYAPLAAGAQRLGAAFQKVNFLRDLGQDHDALGRTYFPGLDPAAFSDAHRDMLLDDIEEDLRVAHSALAQLPTSSRRAVWVTHALFGELARRLRDTPATEIRRQRVRVPDLVKAKILLRAAVAGGR